MLRSMPTPLPEYSQRHLDPEQAAAYRTKFQRSFTRRLSTQREHKLVAAALVAALAWLERELEIAPAAAKLLDYPSGAGRFAPLCASLVGGYLPGDHSPHMLDLTEAALAEAGLASKQIGRTEGDARHMTLPDQAVDLGLNMRLLHHFPARDDRVSILRELRRVVAGPLVTSFLDADSFKQRRHVAQLTKKKRTSRRVLVSLTEFADELETAGWQLVDSWALSSLFSGQRIALCVPSRSAERDSD